MSRPRLVSWKIDPMNKWYPSKSGRIVMDNKWMQELEEASIAERVLNNVKVVCSMTSSSIADLTRRFLGETIDSVEDIRYDQAIRLLESYENLEPETYEDNDPYYQKQEAQHNDNPEAILMMKENHSLLIKLAQTLHTVTRQRQPGK